MKLALINPGKRIEFAVTEPLNLEAIASYVSQYGVDVRIIDELAAQNVQREILRYKPDIVGVTGTTPLILDAYRIADMCREMGILTVLGGVHATVMSEEALRHADIVVKGEGEIAMLQIIQQGIKSGIVNGTPLNNLDDIPIFDKAGVEIDFYLRMPETYAICVSSGMLAGSILGSRGCNNKCIFCHNSWDGLPYRCNSVKRVMDEIQYLVKRYRIKAFSFIDDNLFMNRPRLHQICHELIDSDLHLVWGAQARVDNIDIETLQLVKRAGCRAVGFGFESGSQRILDVLNKKTTVEQNIDAIKMCREVGIMVSSAFMIGSPTETIEDIRMTQEFIKNYPIDSASVWITTPFPGTQLWDWGREKGLIPEHPDWSKFIFTKATKGVLACDTIPISELETLYKETEQLVNNAKNRVSPKWIISMGIHHPRKSITISLRSRKSWINYANRLRRKDGKN